MLNSPICFNEEAISDDDRTKIIDYFCSDKVANDKAIFIRSRDENMAGLFEGSEKDYCFVKTVTTPGTSPSASWAGLRNSECWEHLGRAAGPRAATPS